MCLCGQVLVSLTHLGKEVLPHSSLQNYQFAWISWVNCPFQVPSQIVSRTEVRAPIWPLQNIQLVVFKSFLCAFDCVFCVIVALGGKFSIKLEFSCRLLQVVLQDFPWCAALFLPSSFTSLPGPDAEEYPNIMFPTLYFTVEMVCLVFAEHSVWPDDQKGSFSSHHTKESSSIWFHLPSDKFWWKWYMTFF